MKPVRWISLLIVLSVLIAFTRVPAGALAQGASIPTPPPPEGTSPYFSSRTITLADGRAVDELIIHGPPAPPKGYEVERFGIELPRTNRALGTASLPVPAYRWSFGCSATSGAMIAAYWDRSGFPNMYTGPTNGGVMPLDSSPWPFWTDGIGDTYAQCPLTASHLGLDGRATRGSIDDYWVSYLSSANDPYITNGWTQHTWGTAIGDYMKTSQSAYTNVDGSTSFYTWNSSATPLTCANMETYGITRDGTYGRKLFYEARGYIVTDCYNQKTSNNGGNFTFNSYKAEIDAGRPVMLNLAGHTVVGLGYDDSGSTVYLHDTWDYNTHSMTWGTSYSGMALQSVSIVNFYAPNPTPAITGFAPPVATVGSADFTLTVNGSNFIPTSVVRWNGSARPTTYVSGTQLTATITAADVAATGRFTVAVYNPAPGGGVASATYDVRPHLTGLSPATVFAGGPDFVLTVTGVGFTASSQIEWERVTFATTVVSPSELRATIPAARIAAAGTARVRVWDTSLGGPTVDELTVQIDHPSYTVALQPGWNLVSFNLHPADTAVAQVLASISGSYDLVYAWQGSNPPGSTWLLYDVAVPPYLNTLTVLDEKTSCWVHITAAAPVSLVVTGSYPAATMHTLSTAAGGWNMVGYPAMAAMSLPGSLPAAAGLVYAYHPGDAQPWKIYDPAMPPFMNSLTSLTPGWGYWIYVTENTTWTVTYP